MLVSGFVKFFKETPNVLGREMTVSDLEIMITKYKTQGEKHLSYVQFAAALDMVNATLFEDVLAQVTAHSRSLDVRATWLTKVRGPSPAAAGRRTDAPARPRTSAVHRTRVGVARP